MIITRRTAVLSLAGASALSLVSCSTVGEDSQHAGDLGVLVMAHGAGPAWNGEVEAMLSSLSKDYPLEIAFGMAEAASLQTGVAKLEERGVRRIAVVRLFISGESWYERTEQILGLTPGAEPRAAGHGGHGDHSDHGEAGQHSMALWRIETQSSFAISKEGLADAPEMGAVLVERVRGLSKNPASESVLVLAHGPETDEENQRWLQLIDARAEAVRRAGPFRRVQTETLREDWPDKRAASEIRIRAFVEQASQNDGRVIVVPYRVAGFGPYADVLKGFDYVADQKGLLPSADVESWVRRQIKELSGGPFRKPQHAHAA
jgi:sirohydrochlorin cobaltochelatase